MPPRIPILTCLRASKPSPSPSFTLPLRPFSATANSLAIASDKKRKHLDPYTLAIRNRKIAAQRSRQAELQQERAQSLGDPVRGVTTPFVASFDTASPLEPSPDVKMPQEIDKLNYGLKPEDVELSLERSRELAVTELEPTEMPSPLKENNQTKTEEQYKRELKAAKKKKADKLHETASIALERIAALENGSSKNRMKVNVARCVNTFGRHNTDIIFPPKAPGLKDVSDATSAPIRPQTNYEAAQKRAGPDTGSSEVQIAILTAKIRTLANFLEKHGNKDKHNKRNLRLLVHRRQKLLQYLRRKERGGPRWQHCIETLGLTEGTWKGEISL